VVSILHNFAYYLTDSLSMGNILRASLISLALPLAIAAFSDERRKPATALTKAAPVAIVAKTAKAQPAPAQRPTVATGKKLTAQERRAEVERLIASKAVTSEAELAKMFQVHPSTINRDVAGLQEAGVSVNGFGGK